MMYGLALEILFAIGLAAFGVLSYSPISMLASAIILVVVAQGSNMLFAKLFHAVRNSESAIITALLLFFVMDPTIASAHDALILALAAVVAMASKYLLAIGHKHLFNPVAITAVIFDIAGIGIALWWIATPWLLPFALIFGLLVVRKIRRFHVLIPFTVMAIIFAFIHQTSFASLFLSWPIVFFGTMMLIEPRTAPLTYRDQMIYGGVVGILFASPMALIGQVSLTPELSLVLTNLVVYFISSKQVLTLTCKRITDSTTQICDIAFASKKKIAFIPGQYLEWTLPVAHADSRGNRRYFTIASSPTDDEIHLGVRIDREHGSAFKKTLLAMKEGDILTASHVSGDFILPTNANQKLVFCAGGVGVTPFWSMTQWLAATNQKRDIVFFYGANSEMDFAYKAELDRIAPLIGMKIVYVVAKPSPAWAGKSGYLSKEIVASEVSDLKERKFYLSGPGIMVSNYKKMLLEMGVKNSMIKTDYFPGF